MSRYINYALTFLILGILLRSQNSMAVGTLVIEKATDPSGFDGFDFLLDGPSSDTSFTLDDGELQTFDNLDADTYTVSETDTASGF